MTVRCERCGSAYETEAPIAVIREVNRCRECGGGSLTVAREDGIEREDEEPRASVDRRGGGPSTPERSLDAPAARRR